MKYVQTDAKFPLVLHQMFFKHRKDDFTNSLKGFSGFSLVGYNNDQGFYQFMTSKI
jgi:hypothetical protein